MALYVNIPPSSSSSDPWDFEIDVLGAPVPFLDIPVTASDSRYASIDFEALIVWDPLIGTTLVGLGVYFNNDTTAANYTYSMQRNTEDASAAADQGGNATRIAIATRTFGSAVTQAKIKGNLQIAPKGTNAPRRGCFGETSQWDVGKAEMDRFSLHWTNTASDVTSVRFSTDAQDINIWGTGSYLKYRLVG